MQVAKIRDLNIFAKLEYYNPFGSLKDRAAYYMLQRAIGEGKLGNNGSRHKKIVEPTSGNTGASLSGYGAKLGYETEIVISRKSSPETKQHIRNLGGKLLEVDDDLCPNVGPADQARRLTRALLLNHPGEYYSPNQYDNDENFRAHYFGTGPEIWKQTGGKVDYFIAGGGTYGTLTGVGTFLKEKNPDVKIIAVTPLNSDHHLQGLRHRKADEPELLKRRRSVIDGWIEVDDKEAFAEIRNLSYPHEYESRSSCNCSKFSANNMFVGPSSGAVQSAAKQLAEIYEGNAVMIFADSGEKYRSWYLESELFAPSEIDILISRQQKLFRVARVPESG